jgi:dTDP-4-amino-4,6-dideoxygalactose transaminase
MDPIVEIAQKYHLAIIEDAAQVIRAKYKGKKVGEMGTAATNSFFLTKNFGAYGDGGMIVTNDDDVVEKCRVSLDELQAAILNVKFPHLNRWSEERRKRATYYTERLNEKLSRVIQTPVEKEKSYHVFHQYTLRVPKRDELQKYLKEKGIATMIYYPLPLHLQPVFKELGYQEGDFPEAEKVTKEALSLPMYLELRQEEQDYVIEKTSNFIQNKQGVCKHVSINGSRHMSATCKSSSRFSGATQVCERNFSNTGR